MRIGFAGDFQTLRTMFEKSLAVRINAQPVSIDTSVQISGRFEGRRDKGDYFGALMIPFPPSYLNETDLLNVDVFCTNCTQLILSTLAIIIRHEL